MRSIGARLERLEQQAGGAGEGEALPPVVVLHFYAHDGTPLSTPPVPDGALLIRRQIVEAENGAPAPGYVPIHRRQAAEPQEADVIRVQSGGV